MERHIIEFKPSINQYSVFNVGPYGGKQNLRCRISEEELERNFFKCDFCGFWHPISDKIVATNGKKGNNQCLRQSGYTLVAHANAWYHTNECVYITTPGGYVTREYYNSHIAEYFQCPRCSRIYKRGQVNTFTALNGVEYCASCRTYVCNPIQSYHTMKNQGIFTKHFEEGETEENNVLMGYELEVDRGNDRVTTASCLQTKFGGFFRYERDGSLDNGFEIISEPATLAYHLNTDFAFLRNTLRRDGFTSHNARTCGLHVHLNKMYFGRNTRDQDVATIKLLWMFDTFWDELYKFSRRENTRWCAHYTDSPAYVVSNKRYFSRYYAVNLTNNNTIEIRLWRGSLNVETIKATLKMSEHLARFAKTKTMDEIRAMSFTDLFEGDEDITNYWNRLNSNSSNNNFDDN